jgi:hypothetical protein
MSQPGRISGNRRRSGSVPSVREREGGGCLSNAAAVERKTEREPPLARAPMKHSSTYELSSHEAAHL